MVEPLERIRATVIGASQFTVQVSGKTIYLPDASVLPVHNVPVVHLCQELDDDIAVAAVAAAFARRAAVLDLEPGARLARRAHARPAACDGARGDAVRSPPPAGATSPCS